MAVLALVLYAVWGLLGFGVRMVVQYRRTGDTGLRGAGGQPGSAQWWTRVGFAVALSLGVAAPIVDVADGLEPVAVLDHGWVAALGVVTASLGIAGTLATQLAMGESWRIGVDEHERTALVTGGPFAVVRNPIYSAMVMTAVGLALMVPNVVALAALAVLAVALQLQVRVVEEPYLRRVHGPAFDAYAGTVGRFVPGVGKIRRAGTAGTT